jgi:hypothetical protein
MKRSSVLNYVAIALLLLLSGAAAALAPRLANPGGPTATRIEVPSEPAIVTIDIQNLLLGDELMKLPFLADLNGREVSSFLLIGIMAAVIIGATLVPGAILYAIYTRLDNTTISTKEDESFKQGVQAIEQKNKAWVRERLESRAPKPRPSGEIPRWSTASTTLIVAFFALMLGALVGASFFPGGEILMGDGADARVLNPAAVFGWSTGLIALVVGLLAFRPGRLLTVDESDYATTNWGMVWVIISGALVLILGMGLTLWVMAGGSGA